MIDTTNLFRDGNIWTNRFGLARTVIASSQIATLLLSAPRSLWAPLPVLRQDDPPYCDPDIAASLFCVAPSLEVGRWLAIAGLFIVAIGWRPRISGILHLYISWSCFVGFTLGDGGDQVAAIVSALLLPACLTDARAWHWQDPPSRTAVARRFSAWTSHKLTRIQACVIYGHAFVGKLFVDEWVNGTALYYWLTNPQFGMPDWLLPIFRPVLFSGWVLPVMTWMVLLTEFGLAAAIIAHRKARRVLFFAGLILHASIIVLHGVSSFSVIMIGLLVLYLTDLSQPLRLTVLSDLIVSSRAFLRGSRQSGKRRDAVLGS